jgi:hypothetical protein
MAVLPNGTQYAVCTTLHYYGYKPSANATMLTVEPQTTQTMQTKKTPEQMEQEAKASGWFWIEPWFSWWYPWFRLHYRLCALLPQGNPNINYGWSLLPFGDSYEANDTTIAYLLNDVSNEFDPLALVDLVIGILLQYGLALVMGSTLFYMAIAIGLYTAYSVVRAVQQYYSSGSNAKAWLISFICSLITVSGGLAIGGFMSSVQAVGNVLTAASRQLLRGINYHITNALRGFKLSYLAVVGAVFTIIDFVLMVYYLSMFLSSIV